MAYTRDPLAERFDPLARRLVTAAYDNYGEWTGFLLPPPGMRARAWMMAHGIRPYERDRWGELRYVRAFKRSVFWQVKWYGGVHELRGQRNTASGGAESHWGAPVRVQWETGRLVDVPGQYLALQAVRIRIWPNSKRTNQEGMRKALREGNNWVTAQGHANQRQSNPEYGDRPWE